MARTVLVVYALPRGLHGQGLSFGHDAVEYDRHRPRYADAAVRWALEGVHLGASVLDAGAGTGILARQVQALGFDVCACEPDARMARLAGDLGVPFVMECPAEDIPLPNESVAAVVVGQAWHWFDATRALIEFERLLTPGGPLAILVNLWDDDCTWLTDLQVALGLVSPSRTLVESGVEFGSRFSAGTVRSFKHQQELSVSQVASLFESMAIVRASADPAATVRMAVEAAAAHQHEGMVTIPMVTTVLRARRLDCGQ